MKKIKFNQPVKSFWMAVCIAIFSFSAFAQYQWLDANGRKVFSDQPPPASVPADKLVQQPRQTVASGNRNTQTANASAEAAKASAASEIAASSSKEPKEIAEKNKIDKELEAKKKQADEAEAAKKKAEEERIAKAKADNCARAQSAKAGLDSGARIAVTNAKGERVVMDEAARMVETKRIQGIMQSDCK